MASYGDQKINCTKGREEQAKIRYSKIKNLIISNTDGPLNEVIPRIAKVSSASFHRYCSSGAVSLYAARNLAEYFKLDIYFFTCEDNELFEKKIPTDERNPETEKQIIDEFEQKIENCLKEKWNLSGNNSDEDIISCIETALDKINEVNESLIQIKRLLKKTNRS